MPPRAAKKAAGPGTKRAARGRGIPKAAAPPPAPEVVVDESVKDEEIKEEVKIETLSVEVKEVVEEKNLLEDDIDDDDDKVEEKLVQTGSISEKQEEDSVKESVEEYEKGERLDFGDNDPEEEEPEEYGAMDYDEKEIEQEDVQEEVDDFEEEAEDGDVGEEEEEEGDMAEEEIEEAPEELEGEEDEENGEEHTEMIDTEEREEHRNVYKERRKRKEFEIFVGGLDKDATEDDLRKVFREVGEVTEVRLMMNAQTKKNKGFAFLRFATVEQAKRACAELKSPVVNGKQCGVTPSQDSDTLFLGNICKSWTKEALKEKLKHYEVDTLEDLTLVEDSNNEGMNRGFAFLEFSSRSDAMDAFKRLQKRDVTFGVDRPAKVSFAAQIDPDDEEMAQVTTIFVDGLPASWDEDRVRELLKKYGEVVKIELARNMPSAKRKDFGFVTFGTHNEAVACANNINNETLGEGDNSAKVRARLSRPLQRGRGKFAPRGDFRPGRPAPGGFRSPWARPVPRSLPVRPVRRVGGGRLPPIVDRGFKRPAGFIRDRRPITAMPPRSRPVAPLPRSYDRRPPVPSYPKSSSVKRDYGRREELPPRSRAAADYGPRGVSSERRSSYRDEYPSRGSAYADLPRGSSRPSARRAFADDNYGQRFERPPPSYREGRPRDYDSVSGSKRPYSALDDVPPRYAETGVRQSRPRLDYELGSGGSQYGDAYNDRMGRSNVAYSSSRSSISSQESPGIYSSRQAMSYGGGSYSGSDGGGMYSSYGGDYVSRGSDVGGSSYSSSLYSGRSLGGGGSYMGSGGSGSYY